MKPSVKVNDTRRDVAFSLKGLSPTLSQEETLVLAMPTYQAQGPILNKEEAERLQEAMGLTMREVEEAIERMVEGLEALSLGKMLMGRRVHR